MTTALRPIVAPAPHIGPGPTRNLLAALHECGWKTTPATSGHLTVFSPDLSRSMVVELAEIPPTPDADVDLRVFIDGKWLPTAWAVTYVRGSA